MKVLFFVIDWLWCFPQTLFGFIVKNTLWKYSNITHFRRVQNMHAHVIIFESTNEQEFQRRKTIFSKLTGFSLGRHIFLHANDIKIDKYVIQHEFGHTRQSRMLGWLYLPVIGLSSAILNIRSRKDKNLGNNYYKQFPERWADKLGKVTGRK